MVSTKKQSVNDCLKNKRRKGCSENQGAGFIIDNSRVYCLIKGRNHGKLALILRFQM
jgi:hypothetical protein